MNWSYDAVLLIGFGGPTRAEEVRPFLNNVLRGRPVARDRYEEVAHHYEVMGGSSPYNQQTENQAVALRALLKSRNAAVPVYVGMRNWAPHLATTIAEIARSGARRVFGFVLAPHRCEASWDRYIASVNHALQKSGATHLKIDYPALWNNHPLFIEAWAERLKASVARLDDVERSNAEIVFTAHSIPIAMAKASAYVEQLRDSSKMVARAL
ncbi:MAG TPA: ferrochelatase, partial [Candidatus Binataceae bacterium]